ncbi:DASH complex subunit DAM1 [Kwoniella heveanensis CBS 569]|nr:DASH complex subunit DAM1 [Kwoniella heveanensis CBS 569]
MTRPHPLRRISTGSLSSLARSTDRAHTSPSGLDHLSSALMDLSDEAATLSANVQQMTALHDALGTFNEAFAGYLYALKMNAFCVEWPQAPNELSFQRMESLEVPDPIPQSSLQLPTSPHSGPTRSSASGTAGSSAMNPADMTYATAYSNSMSEEVLRPVRPKSSASGGGAGAARQGPATGLKKTATAVPAKKGLTNAAARKKRELEISGIIDTLPLEYRGGEPVERMRMEKVIAKLMDHPEGISMKEMVEPPELPQTKLNKCLIALVAKKLVSKPIVDKITLYRWEGL